MAKCKIIDLCCEIHVSQFKGHEIMVEANVRNFVNQLGHRIQDKEAMLMRVGLSPQPTRKLKEAAPKHDPTSTGKPNKKQKTTKPKAPTAAKNEERKKKKKNVEAATAEPCGTPVAVPEAPTPTEDDERMK